MRIVELVPTLQVGGAERVVTLLGQGLRDLGHEVDVVVLGAPQGGHLEALVRASPGLGLHFLGKGAGWEARPVARLVRLLRARRPAIVHTHLHVLKYLLPALALVPGPRPRVVHTLHNLAQHEAVPADRALQQVAFRAGVRPVAIGQAVARSLREVYGLDPAATIENGIPVAAQRVPPGTGPALRAALGLPAQAPVFLFAGRLNPQKDPVRLVRAFADPALAALGAHLLLAGGGELEGELRALVAARGLGARVHLLGVRPDVPALLAAADAFVLPSRFEGHPLVVMEAMAAGRAVLASAVGCVPELVGPGEGRLVPPEVEAPLAEALVALARDLPATRRLGEAGAAVAEARFDTAIMARAYARLFGRLGRDQMAPR